MSTTPPPYQGAPEAGEPAAPGPRRRVVRTAVQVLVAVLLAVPAALAAVAAAGVELPAGATAIIAGGTGGLVILISAGQNAYDQHRGVG